MLHQERKLLQALLLFFLMGYSAMKRTRSGRSAGAGYSVRQDTLGREETLPLFALDFAPSIANLPRQVNGVDPVLWSTADGSGGMTSEFGPALSEAGSGASPSDVGDYHPLFGSTDHGTEFHGDKRLSEASAGTYAGSNNHLLFKFLVNAHDTATEALVATSSSSSAVGWLLLRVGSNFRFYLSDGVTSVYCVSPAIPVNEWNYLEVRIDKTQSAAADSCTIFANGVAGSSVNCSTVTGAIDGSSVFTIGSYSNGGSRIEASIALSTLHAAADLGYSGSTNDVDWLAAHKENFARLTGTYATAKGESVPTTMTRASAKYIFKQNALGDLHAVKVGAGWPDICRMLDSSTGLLHTGFRGENAATTGAEDSGDLGAASWTQVAMTSSTLSATQKGPFNEFASALIANATTAAHYVHEAGGVGSARHTLAFLVAGGDKAECKINVTVSGKAVSAYYTVPADRTTGAVGTQGADNGGAEIRSLGLHFGKYWWKCSLWYPTPASSHEHQFSFVDAGETDSYLGDGTTIDGYVQHYQHEEGGGDDITSPISASGGTATRALDSMRWDGTDNIAASGQDVRFNALAIGGGYTPNSNEVYFTISDGGSSDYVSLLTASGVNKIWMLAATLGSLVVNSQAGSGMPPAASVAVRTVNAGGEARVYLDNVLTIEDTSAPTPANLSVITLRDYAPVGGNEPPDGRILVSAFEIFKA